MTKGENGNSLKKRAESNEGKERKREREREKKYFSNVSRGVMI